MLQIDTLPLSSLSDGEKDKLNSFLLRVLHKLEEEKAADSSSPTGTGDTADSNQ